MKRTLLLTYIFVSTAIFAQSDNQEGFYKAYLNSDLEFLKTYIDGHNNDELLKSTDIDLLTSELESYYVLLSSTLSYEDEEETFDNYVDNHIAIAERIIALDEKNAVANAMLSGIYGLKIAYSPMKSMFLGPKSNSHSSKSMEFDKEDPVVLLMYGINKYNTPKTWGGDVDAAIEALNKVTKIYEEKEQIKGNWKYLHALAWLGISHEEKKEFNQAKKVYQKSVKTEPEFKWGELLLSEIDQ